MNVITYPTRTFDRVKIGDHNYALHVIQDGRIVFMCQHCDNVLSLSQVLAIINKAA